MALPLPKQLSLEAIQLFREGINLTLARWSALQMAVDNMWGGRKSRETADQLASEVFNWFTLSREPLYIDDLEDILDEGMVALNTMIEDGSVEEVAEKLMIIHEECLEGNFKSIEKLRESSLHRVAPSHVKQVVDDEDGDSESDDESQGMVEGDSSYMMVDAPNGQSNPGTSSIQVDKVRPAGTVDSDGWTVVGSRKGRVKKK